MKEIKILNWEQVKEYISTLSTENAWEAGRRSVYFRTDTVFRIRPDGSIEGAPDADQFTRPDLGDLPGNDAYLMTKTATDELDRN